jgi:hypothetical protein
MFNRPNQNPAPMYPSMQFERLQYEILENKRKLNNIAKRLTRIESYLRIKDTSDYSYVEDKGPEDFSF